MDKFMVLEKRPNIRGVEVQLFFFICGHNSTILNSVFF
jgi:hypothetical protein